jgi:hypothetical protein
MLLKFSFLIYRENESTQFLSIRGLHSFMYCELISTIVILVINIPLSLSLDYHFHVCSMHEPNQCVELRRCQETHNQLPHPMSHS